MAIIDILRSMIKRGINLVANQKSQQMCENLIFSIRNTGCELPIRIIHFGGKPVNSDYLLTEAELVYFEDAPQEAQAFVHELRTVLTECPLGYLYRYLAWFSDWDEFIYSDNDVVALCNWEILLDKLRGVDEAANFDRVQGFKEAQGFDLVHADEEYTTKGVFNYNRPDKLCEIFGDNALSSAFTAGHIVVRKNDKMIEDFRAAMAWFKEHPEIPQKHDQSLMHVSSLLGNWKILNLCKEQNWLSSWAGDYRNSLHLIQKIQGHNARISHIHYSGGTPNGDLAIQDLLLSRQDDRGRMKQLAGIVVNHFTGYYKMRHWHTRGRRFLKRVAATF